MARPSFRVHLVTHHDGRITGRLLPSGGREERPVAGYGKDKEQVLSQLTLAVEERREEVPGYLWEDAVELRQVRVSMHPQSVVKKRHVIGKQEIILPITYVCCRQSEGGYRVLVPRFGWWFVLEDTDMAPGVIKQAVGTELLGEGGASLLSFRPVASEEVIEWSPRLSRESSRRRNTPQTSTTPTLHAVAEEWVAQARRKRSRPVVGRVDVERWLPLVLREIPRSLLLVGPAGCGKTTWVRALARRLGRLDATEHPFVPRIWATSAERIVAGMMYLGQWEQRCLDLVTELSGEGDLLYVSDLAGLVRTRTGRSSIADMLLPAVRDRELSLVSECDAATLELLSSQHPVLLGQFVPVRIDEPSTSAMPSLLDEYQRRVMRGLRIEPAGLRRLVQHLDLFQRDTGFPGKGVRFIDWLAAEQNATASLASLTRPDEAGEGGTGGTGTSEAAETEAAGAEAAGAEAGAEAAGAEAAGAEAAGAEAADAEATPAERRQERDESVRTLTADEVSEAFARSTGLPLEIISDVHTASLAAVRARLETGVVGQPQACQVAARVITRLKAGLTDPSRPIGSLLLVGPTGVGKTELAKQLTRYLFGSADRMIRLDMSEYMMPGSAARLLAVGRGVSSLVQRVRSQPLSLVLLDEIEKAHPEVFDLLLAMLGEGRMTDVLGRLTDFSMSLVVMTSNLGVTRTATPGFGGRRAEGAELVGEVRKHFRPEFFNRIDHVVPFGSLTPEDILRVVDLELHKVSRREGLTRRGLTVVVGAEARRRLAELGFHPTRGARPLRRTIEEKVMGPLSIRLAEDRTLRDARIHVVVEGSEQHRLRAERGQITIVL